jgi:protein-S-isoprenylcysteine O-methyltransferase Ste14
MNAARISVLGFVVAVIGLLGLAFTDQLWGIGPISIGLQVLAALFMIWARLTFGLRSFHAAATTTEGGLVTHGPYAIVRNPIYAAVLLFGWTAVAVHFSLGSLPFGLGITGGLLVRVFAEEHELRARYPEYAGYARRVKRLIPFVF